MPKEQRNKRRKTWRNGKKYTHHTYYIFKLIPYENRDIERERANRVVSVCRLRRSSKEIKTAIFEIPYNWAKAKARARATSPTDTYNIMHAQRHTIATESESNPKPNHTIPNRIHWMKRAPVFWHIHTIYVYIYIYVACVHTHCHARQWKTTCQRCKHIVWFIWFRSAL